MQLTSTLLYIDPGATQKKITSFIKDYAAKAKVKGLVLGVSGGLDSATTVALATKALGARRVLALYMPEKETYSNTDHKHVRLLAEKLKFQLEIIDLTETLEAFYRTIPNYDPRDYLSRGNLKARIRMLIWYYYANHQNRIVATSSDKSEAMIGYYTKWGDVAADIAPLMDLYKTQVRQLALYLDIPEGIAKKPPTPALWPNQTAEGEIGLKYEDLDLVLYGLEHFMPTQTIAEQLHMPAQTVTAVKKRWLQAEHKRRMPLTTKLEYRTISHDFRLNRTTELE